MIRLTDGKNQTTGWGIDIYGRQTSKTNALGTETARLAYDPNDNLLSRWTPAKGTTFYTNDAVGKLTDINYPNSPDIALQYDSLNQLTNMTDAVGTNRYNYNSAGQLLSEDGPWANDTLNYTYNNRLRASLTLQQPSGTWTNGYFYDATKRLTNITSQAGSFVYRYGQANSHFLASISLPGGSYITNTYDSVTRLLVTQLKNSGGTALNSHSYGYNLASQGTTLTNTAGDYRNYTYDNSSQLKTALGYESDGSPRLNEKHGYAYDPAGNLNYRTNNAFLQTFAVNSLNELSNATRSGTLTVAGNTTTAATNVTVNGLTAPRYSDNTFAKDGFPLVDGTTNFTAIAANSVGLLDTNIITVNLAATNSFVYDLNGNLTSDGQRGLDYDDENQLIRVTVTNQFKKEFVYDGANRLRVRKEYLWTGSTWSQTNETRFICDGVLPIQHRDGNNAPTLSLTRGLDLSGSLQVAGGIGGLLAMTESNGTHSYYHSDGNGNVTALVNANQLIVARRTYEPFGATLSLSGPKVSVNPYWFSSELWDSDTGFLHYPRRVYIPALQRFANHDPIEEAGGLNLYGFVGNDPIGAYDPLGLAWYDDVSAWWGARASFSKNYLDNNAHWLVAGVGDTVLDIGHGFTSIPAMLGHFGEGTGTFSADPTLENSIGMVNDFNVAMSFALPIAAKCPASPKATPTPTQLEFDFVNGDLSGKLTSFAIQQRVLLEVGRQGKHIQGHNNFISDRSPFTHKDPQGLLDRFAGKGQQAGQIPRGQPGFKERVDFGEVIGTVKGKPTTKGIIHYSKKGAHIVPANP